MSFCFPLQRDEEDGGDMDSYQVLPPLSANPVHGAQLSLIASLRKAEAREVETGPRSESCGFSLAFDLLCM